MPLPKDETDELCEVMWDAQEHEIQWKELKRRALTGAERQAMLYVNQTRQIARAVLDRYAKKPGRRFN